MTRKVNYNNPIMKEYINRGKNQVQVSNGSTFVNVRSKFSGGGVPYTTTAFVFEENSTKKDTSMTTAEKIAAGIQIAGALTSGTATVIGAIADLKAKQAEANPNGATNTSAPASTGKDAPVYSSDAKQAKAEAKDSSNTVNDAVKEYKKTGDRSALEAAVRNAKTDFENNGSAITSLKNDIDVKKKEYDEAKKAYNDFHDGEYKTAVKTKKETADAYNKAEKAANSAKGEYETAQAGTKKAQDALNNLKEVKDPGQEPEDETQKAQWKADKQAYDDYVNEKKRLESELETAQGTEKEKKEAYDKAETAKKEAQDARDEAVKAFNEADSADKANKATMNAAEDDYKRVKSDNEKEIKRYESANSKLETAIKNGNKALGSYSV
ncbi:hypothetical protein IJ732_05810 [bacterium]|nr:hypothetical protein [bacterium]